MAKLSAVIIACDAARQLPKCLAALEFCDEILVVDSGSADETVAVARHHGARVIETHWRGFGPQKQFAVAQAAHDWVLCVDADERVSGLLRDAVLAVLPAPTCSAYRFARCNRFMGAYLKHGEGYPDWSLRLFDRRRAAWTDDPVHERVVTAGPVGTLKGDLYHESVETLENYLEKQNRYSSLAATQAHAAGKASSALRMLASPLARFIKFYLLRRGFLDGIPGLTHILIGCYASFAKHAKMLAMQIEDRTRS